MVPRTVMVGALLMSCASADKLGGAPPTPTREVAAGAARLRGGGITMDVTIGRGSLTRPVSGGTTRAVPHAAVQP